MTWWRAVIGVSRADFRERSRTLSLLAVPIAIAYVVKLATVDATLYVAGEYTGTLNAAWFGGVVAGIATLIFFLFGYPLVSGSINRDHHSGVGELIATSPVSNTSYLLGKWLSNLAVLTVATGVLAATTTASFLLQGTGPLNLTALLSPFLLVTMPTMTVVAAAAVCFETIDRLRGTLGTVVYVASVFALVIASIPPHSPLDFTGLVLLRESMGTSIAAQYPSFKGPVGSFAYATTRATVTTFTWNGLAWTPNTLQSRLPVLGTTVGLLAVARLSFDRFRSSKATTDKTADKTCDASPSIGPPIHTDEPRDISSAADLPPVTTATGSLLPVLLGELRLSLRGQSWWWYLCGVLGIAAIAIAPLDTVRSLIIPISLLLLLPVWSQLGTREQRYRTEELVFTTSGPARLLGVSYVVATGMGVLLVSPGLLRFMRIGMGAAFLGVLAGVLFVPAAALALGVWTGRPRVFEVAYLVAWYIGPMNTVLPLDYIGAHTTGLSIPITYLVLTPIALVLAVIGRHRQWK